MKLPVLGSAIPRRGNALSGALARAILGLLGWRFEGQIPNLAQFVIIGAPHTSNWDFPLAMGYIFALGIRVYWMGKHTFFRWPITRLLNWLGGVPVDRRSSMGVVDQMVAQFAQRPQFILGLSPEGTRRRVNQWKSGFYHIALGAGVPIVPLALDYGRKVLAIGEPLMPTGDKAGDLAYFRAFFRDVVGKNAALFGPITMDGDGAGGAQDSSGDGDGRLAE